MTITVAMALSGLEPEQWNDGLKEIYMQGAFLFPKSPSSLSLASSGASSYYSLESGISSMSPDSASYNPYILNDLDGLALDGIVHIQEMINEDNLRNTPTDETDDTKLTTTLEAAKETNEYVLSSAADEALNEQNDFDDIASSIVALIEEECEPEPQPNKVYSKVMYGNRDVLNLYANISFGGWQLQPTALPLDAIDIYFENRSQYSRLQDAYPPKHAKAICRDKDCAFVEASYF